MFPPDLTYVAIGNAEGSETPERCTDHSSSRDAGGKRARRVTLGANGQRPVAPGVTCVAVGSAATPPESGFRSIPVIP